jgi:hypothetical protein
MLSKHAHLNKTQIFMAMTLLMCMQVAQVAAVVNVNLDQDVLDGLLVFFFFIVFLV